MWRHVPPSGAPIRSQDLLRWTSLAVGRADVCEGLRALIRSRFDVPHCFLANTGRAGLTLLLQALRRLRPGNLDEVVVPAYTCYSVAASIVKAGLKPRIVDVSAETLDFEPAELSRADFRRVLAIVATNLYGLPSNLPGLSRFARDRGVFVIDDAAQAMGAHIGGRWSGTFGDAGLFSLDKGKNVSAIDGGIVVTASNEIAAEMQGMIARLPAPRAMTSAVHVAKVLAYFAFLRPNLYGIPTRIPQLALGQTQFDTTFSLEAPDRALVGLALTMMPRLEQFTAARMRNADALQHGLANLRAPRPIAVLAGAGPAFLRLPVLFASGAARDAALAALVKAGIGASRSYPASLADVPELQPLLANSSPRVAGGRHVASRIVTLPTHPFVTPSDIDRAVAVLRELDRPSCAA